MSRPTGALRPDELCEKLCRELGEMTEEQILDVFDNYDFVDWQGGALAKNLVFQALIRIAKGNRRYVITAP